MIISKVWCKPDLIKVGGFVCVKYFQIQTRGLIRIYVFDIRLYCEIFLESDQAQG